jgi:hypothetical protein
MTIQNNNKKPCAEERHGFESLLPATVLPASGSRGLQHFSSKALDSQLLAPPQSGSEHIDTEWEVNAAHCAAGTRIQVSGFRSVRMMRTACPNLNPEP